MKDYIVYEDEEHCYIVCEVLNNDNSSVLNVEKMLVNNGWIITVADTFQGHIIIKGVKAKQQ